MHFWCFRNLHIHTIYWFFPKILKNISSIDLVCSLNVCKWFKNLFWYFNTKTIWHRIRRSSIESTALTMLSSNNWWLSVTMVVFYTQIFCPAIYDSCLLFEYFMYIWKPKKWLNYLLLFRHLPKPVYYFYTSCLFASPLLTVGL